MVKYHLTENHLTDRADDFTAQVQALTSFNKDAIIKRILQSGTLVTRTDVLASWNVIEETIVAILEEGNTVTTPLFHASFSISGVFDGPMDSFDHLRHKLNINVSKGSSLRTAQNNVKLEKTDAFATASLYIMEVKDSVSGVVNDVLTPSGVLEIYGSHIKIEGSDASCGLYFVNSEGVAIKAVTIVQNKPSTVIAMIPTLAVGVYHVKIVTQFNGSVEVKQAREYTFDHQLTVQA